MKLIHKFNHNHGAGGRFSSSNESSSLKDAHLTAALYHRTAAKDHRDGDAHAWQSTDVAEAATKKTGMRLPYNGDEFLSKSPVGLHLSAAKAHEREAAKL